MTCFVILVQACSPLTVINGKVLGIGTLIGSVIRIQCKDGYHLRSTDPVYRTCQRGGHWTGGAKIVTCHCKYVWYI